MVFPIEVLHVICNSSNAAVLRNVRATCNLLQNDNDIAKMQENAQLAEPLESYLTDIPRESIPAVIEELNKYKAKLSEEFSNRNCFEIETIAEKFEQELDDESEAIFEETAHKMLSGCEPEKVVLDDKSSINQIKKCMLKQEILIAGLEFHDGNSDYKVAQNEIHKKMLCETLQRWARAGENCDISWLINGGLKLQHQIENAAAAFSSKPKEMHVFLKERQQSDNGLKDDLFIKQDFERPNKKVRHF